MKKLSKFISILFAICTLFISCALRNPVAGKSYSASVFMGIEVTYAFEENTYTASALDFIVEEGTYTYNGNIITCNNGQTISTFKVENNTLIDSEGIVLSQITE